MAKTFNFPDVGEGITEGELVKWLVSEGDEVKVDQPLAEIETDKAIVEMPSPYAGVVLKLHVQDKDIIKVGDPLVTIGTAEEAAKKIPAEEKAAEAAEAPPPSAPSPAAEAPAAPAAPVAPPTPAEAPPAAAAGAAMATPKVRQLARELGLQVSSIRGTGPGGRITEDDVRRTKAYPEREALLLKKPVPPSVQAPAAVTEAKPEAEAPAAKPAPEAPRPAFKIKPKYDFYGSVERVPLRGVRRATAKRMRESVDHAVHVTHCDEADATKLELLRQRLKKAAEVKGVNLTYLPIIVKALVEALKLHPMLNATLDEAEDEIIVKGYYNIGIAVDVPDGLIVPVVKMADDKSVFDIGLEIQNLAMAARDRKLDLADLKGGTFSITNVGVIGGEVATPIINYPEVAILATMKIADRVRAKGTKLVIRKTLPLCLSFDHRVVDGAAAARFTKDLIKFLEDPDSLPLG
jgi:pyruvate dehydrogenase E2 component (dihydrolipoyllysine-residue acetyltransferase)